MIWGYPVELVPQPDGVIAAFDDLVPDVIILPGEYSRCRWVRIEAATLCCELDLWHDEWWTDGRFLYLPVRRGKGGRRC